jgi:hypothetical protein
MIYESISAIGTNDSNDKNERNYALNKSSHNPHDFYQVANVTYLSAFFRILCRTTKIAQIAPT